MPELAGNLRNGHLADDLAKERETRIALQVELTAIKQQFQDHLTQYQERDRRHWGVVVVLIGAVMSMASGLIVALVRK